MDLFAHFALFVVGCCWKSAEGRQGQAILCENVDRRESARGQGEKTLSHLAPQDSPIVRLRCDPPGHVGYLEGRLSTPESGLQMILRETSRLREQLLFAVEESCLIW
jgi:hypothetical protein